MKAGGNLLFENINTYQSNDKNTRFNMIQLLCCSQLFPIEYADSNTEKIYKKYLWFNNIEICFKLDVIFIDGSQWLLKLIGLTKDETKKLY